MLLIITPVNVGLMTCIVVFTRKGVPASMVVFSLILLKVKIPVDVLMWSNVRSSQVSPIAVLISEDVTSNGRQSGHQTFGVIDRVSVTLRSCPAFAVIYVVLSFDWSSPEGIGASLISSRNMQRATPKR